MCSGKGGRRRGGQPLASLGSVPIGALTFLNYRYFGQWDFNGGEIPLHSRNNYAFTSLGSGSAIELFAEQMISVGVSHLL